MITPPTLLRRALATWLPREDRDALLEALDTRYAEKAVAHGFGSAGFWYLGQVISLVAHLGAERIHDLVGGVAGIRDDARLALRSFRRHPAFATSFIATLAIGTGVLATVYTAASWVLLRPVPGVTDAAELSTIRLGSSEAPPHVSWPLSHPDYLTFRDRLPGVGKTAAVTPVEVDLRPDGGEPLRVAGAMVSANYFNTLGVALSAGRGFLPEDEDGSTREVVAVVSHALATQLNSSGSVVGSRLRINGSAVQVIGIASRDFRGASLPGTEHLWLPLSALTLIDPSSNPQAVSMRHEGVWSRLISRAPPGTAIEALGVAANGVMANIRAEFRANSFPATHQQMQVFSGIGLDPSVRASVRRTLSQLGIVAALLLCLAIANLTNLSIIESTRRTTAGAVRVALGASRARLASAAMVEAALLGIGGTVFALWLAWVWSGWYQGTQLNEHGGALTGMRVDLRIALLTLLVAFVGAGIAFLRPASSLRRFSIDRLMRRNASDASAAHRLRGALITAQVALSLVLLVAAGLLGRTVVNLRSINLGFQEEGKLTFALDPHLHGFEARALDVLARRLEQRLTADGGFRGAGFISPAPLRSSFITSALYRSGDPEERPLIAAGFFVTPGFLPAIGARTLAGDSLWQADSATVVITRNVIDSLFPGTSPADMVGRTIPTRPKLGRPVRVAAVIDNLSLSDITREAVPIVFSPLAQRWSGISLTGLVDASGSGRSAASAVQRLISAEAPELPLFDIRTARAAIDLQFADRNAMARAAATLAIIGLALAAVGLYAVLSAVVATRRREIGIRGAMGAAPHRILRRVLANGLIPVALGLPLGLAGSILIGKLLAPRLFGMESLDPVALGGAAGVLLIAAVGAALLPAWRATRISPAEVLREE
jgi:putative ABC transport system permease protein